MEIRFCQACGMILRRSNSCKGCGTPASVHAPTTFVNELTPASALAVPMKNDPMVIERTVNHLMYGSGQSENGGYGGYGGNGGNGGGYKTTAEEVSTAGTFFPRVDGKLWNPKTGAMNFESASSASSLDNTPVNYSSVLDKYETPPESSAGDPDEIEPYLPTSEHPSDSSASRTSAPGQAGTANESGAAEAGLLAVLGNQLSAVAESASVPKAFATPPATTNQARPRVNYDMQSALSRLKQDLAAKKDEVPAQNPAANPDEDSEDPKAAIPASQQFSPTGNQAANSSEESFTAAPTESSPSSYTEQFSTSPTSSDEPFSATPNEALASQNEPFSATPNEEEAPPEESFSATPTVAQSWRDESFSAAPNQTPHDSEDEPFAATPSEVTAASQDEQFSATPATPQNGDATFEAAPLAESSAVSEEEAARIKSEAASKFLADEIETKREEAATEVKNEASRALKDSQPATKKLINFNFFAATEEEQERVHNPNAFSNKEAADDSHTRFLDDKDSRKNSENESDSGRSEKSKRTEKSTEAAEAARKRFSEIEQEKEKSKKKANKERKIEEKKNVGKERNVFGAMVNTQETDDKKDDAREKKKKRKIDEAKEAAEKDEEEEIEDEDENDDGEDEDDAEDKKGAARKGANKKGAETRETKALAKSKSKQKANELIAEISGRDDESLKKHQIHDRFSKNKSTEPDKKVMIMGRSYSQKLLMTIGLLTVMAGFPSLVLVSTLYTIFHEMFPSTGATQTTPTTAAVPVPAGAVGQAGMTGKWDVAFQNARGGLGRGAMEMVQSADKLQGWGLDGNGQFQLGGTIQGTNVAFTKVYVQNGKVLGKPIRYQGVLSTQTLATGPVLQLDGIWQLDKREGFGWRGRVVTYSGKFQARLTGVSSTTASGTATGTATGNTTAMAGIDTTAGASKDPKKAHDFFIQVALGIIAIGVGLALLSLKFFGPSGLLNIWAKKEYIPSQFKAQHLKMVAEMGKPMRPGGLPLGDREEWGLHQFWLPKRLNLPIEERQKNPHMLLIGAGATGKSRLMASMVIQDIESKDRAVVVVDSDGSLADLLLNWIASRPNGSTIAKRVVVLDPTDPNHSLAFNPLEFPEDGDLQSCASAVVFGFKAAYTEPPGSQTQWNQQTANILRNSAVLLMANNRTLTDLPVLLSDNDFRDLMLQTIEQQKDSRSEYITLLDAWTNYKRLARTDQWITWIEPILNRIQPMLSDPRLRGILTKTKSELDLLEIINRKQILIVKIPQGHLERNGNLLGSLMVAGLKQAALSISSRKRHSAHPCSLYLDELDSFIEKETFDTITTETRKLQIGFCGTSKTLQTLPEDFRNQIIINVGIIAIFALAKKDADMLGPQMFRVDGRKVKHQTIQNVFNKVNSSPQFELIMDEEKLNIDRVVGQEKQTYFCYRVGSVAGVFRMKAPIFPDIEEGTVNKDLLEKMKSNRQDVMHAEEDEDETDEEDLDDEDLDDEDDDEDLDDEDQDDQDSEEDDDEKEPANKNVVANKKSNAESAKKKKVTKITKNEDEDEDEEDEDSDDDDDDDEDDEKIEAKNQRKNKVEPIKNRDTKRSKKQ